MLPYNITDVVVYSWNVQPVASRESFAAGKENSRANVNRIANQNDEADAIICSWSSQDKRPRKTSAVYYSFLMLFFEVTLLFLQNWDKPSGNF